MVTKISENREILDPEILAQQDRFQISPGAPTEYSLLIQNADLSDTGELLR